MQSSNDNLCPHCRYGARVQAMGQCGCPGLTANDVAEYAALRGYILKDHKGRWTEESTLFFNMMRREITPTPNNVLRATMVKAATALNGCRRFSPRSEGERDEWKLFSRKGGEQ